MWPKTKPRKRAFRSPGEGGFTLLELLVVAGVFGLLAAISFPSLSDSMSVHRLTAGLRETTGSIRVARSIAVTRNQQARIVLGADGTRLDVEVSPDGATWTNAQQPVVLESGVKVSSVSPTNGLLFSPTGTVVSPVTVTLVNARGNRRQIVVSLLGGVSQS